jgi:feruloyl esterase
MKNIVTLLLCFVITTAQHTQAQNQQVFADTASIRKILGAKQGKIEITALQIITEGSFLQPDGKTVKDLPPFCRVSATLRPTPSSNIKVELWMPLQGWNGRFLGTGNGGGGGWMGYFLVGDGIKRGFAAAHTDMGTSPNADAAVGMPEKWIDFGHRATHEMTLMSKDAIKAFYHKEAHHSYFIGCSTGGQQALSESQKYPLDYSGIIAGAPASNRTHLHTYFVWNHLATNNVNGKILNAKDFELIKSEVLKTCLGKDGGAPGDKFLTDPRYCSFDPSTIPNCTIPGVNPEGCLTGEQLTAIKKLYTGPVNPRTKELIYAPVTFGLENVSLANLSGHFYPFKWTFGSTFNYENFNFDKSMDSVDALLAPNLNANNPNLSPFKKAGGKLIMYTGTMDEIVPYEDAVNYYERVINLQKGVKQTQEFFRYFLIPGMAHCGNGPGISNCGQGLSTDRTLDAEHDMLTALIEWTEKGKAPERFMGSAYQDVNGKKELRAQRPIFPYPMFPDYVSGDVNDPVSYKAVAHERGKVLKPVLKYLK